MSRQSTHTNNQPRIRLYPSGNLTVCCGPASRFAGRARFSNPPIRSLRKPQPESESRHATSSVNFHPALQSRKPERDRETENRRLAGGEDWIRTRGCFSPDDRALLADKLRISPVCGK